jgi:hypothetical protein
MSPAAKRIDPMAVFQNVRDRILDDIDYLRRYTCVQTIVRKDFQLRRLPRRHTCDTAVAGDRLEAVLVTSIAGLWGVAAAPAGSRLRGRLAHVAAFLPGRDRIDLAFSWESIVIDGIDRPFAATEKRGQHMHGATAASTGLVERGAAFSFPANLSRSLGQFTFYTRHLQRKHFDAEWVTAAPRR